MVFSVLDDFNLINSWKPFLGNGQTCFKANGQYVVVAVVISIVMAVESDNCSQMVTGLCPISPTIISNCKVNHVTQDTEPKLPDELNNMGLSIKPTAIFRHCI